MKRNPIRAAFVAVLFLALAAVPPVAGMLGQDYYIGFVARMLIMALAAAGLNIILSYGGMVSLGHALYIGVGAYAVGILSAHGVTSGGAHLAAALGAGLALSLVLGAICLRTSGLAFIMITLAFAQMAYFVVVGARGYGGEDGLPIAQRSAFGAVDLDNDAVFYAVVLATLALVLVLTARMVDSRFGIVLRGSRINEARMRALGFPTFRYRLTAYVISALVCVLAGFFLSNLGRFASPSYMQWTASGELMVMVLLGGTGTVIGPVVGALALLLLETLLVNLKFDSPAGLDGFINDHWLAFVGLFVVIVTLKMRHGLYGALRPTRRPA